MVLHGQSSPILIAEICHWRFFCCSWHEMESVTGVIGPKLMCIFIAVTMKKHAIGFNRHSKHGGILAGRCVWPDFLLIRVNEAMVLIPGQGWGNFFFILSVEICSYHATICERSSPLLAGCFFFFLSFFFFTIWPAAAVDLNLCKGLIWCTLECPRFQTVFLKLERVR